MMITRAIQPILGELAETYPVVTITGPRQSGKTTLARMVFPDYVYCNLEHPDTRMLAQRDPESLFVQFPAPVIIDEIQRVPELFSYIQADVDHKRQNGLYILTGSQQHHLNADISQSLAGRTALLTLLPFSISELSQYSLSSFSREDYLFTGFLPRIYDQKQQPLMAYRNYLNTYVERDVRQLLNLKDLSAFENFLHLLAGRTGQLVNTASLANDTGVSATTISNWLSVLEASYIIFRLSPYYENFGKRVVKSPKLYFIEPGLACYLLGIEDPSQVARDPLLGNLFENMVVAEALKARYNRGLDANLFFFRDSNHNEVDLILKKGNGFFPVEIKSAMTWNDHFATNILKFNTMSRNRHTGCVVYGGRLRFNYTDNIMVTGFERFSELV
ncbi:MAG: ATP-binding protein [Bacteroidales bacterium]|nr:ATP-binding protein [Bacteroidales bacterium]